MGILGAGSFQGVDLFPLEKLLYCGFHFLLRPGKEVFQLTQGDGTSAIEEILKDKKTGLGLIQLLGFGLCGIGYPLFKKADHAGSPSFLGETCGDNLKSFLKMKEGLMKKGGPFGTFKSQLFAKAVGRGRSMPVQVIADPLCLLRKPPIEMFLIVGGASPFGIVETKESR